LTNHELPDFQVGATRAEGVNVVLGVLEDALLEEVAGRG
jgi:hypothetical protein